MAETKDETPSDPQWVWTASQRRVLLVLLVGLFAYLAIRYACNPVYVSDPQPEVPSRYNDLADRIDPNTADWQTLAALPGIGEKKAKDIVAYRDRVKSERPNVPAFSAPQDMLRIKGIGQAMMTGMEPYLIFPTTQPARAE